jgi:HEAT repeat protein
MKYNKYLLFLCAFICAEMNLVGQTENSVQRVTPEEIIASVKANNPDAVDGIVGKLHSERGQLIRELLTVFQDKKSSNVEQCAAAYYFGELKASEAVDALAANITLAFSQPVDHLTILMNASSVEALIKIGNPSIPAMIRNLAESDDSKVRDLSLQVLTRIDGDKDIVQLRLQKALNAETDSTKKARIQSALKSLAAM